MLQLELHSEEEVIMASALEQIKKLQEQQAKLIETATEEALAKAREAVADLNALGHSYDLVEHGKTKKKDAKKREMKDVPCKVCGFKTDPLHDARAHRSQEPKKPYTAAELKERGWSKV